ncbi:MAG TPA: hypothetical protein VN512_08250 [Clostridia bacterium]|nr:hypothetical protein [Clostridia bacterium]
MEAYKKTLQRRIAFLVIPVLVAVILGVYDVFFANPAIENSFLHGFQLRAATALGILAAIFFIRYRSILHDEVKLKHEFNRENDERYKAIRAKAGMPMLLITSSAMIVAAVVAGYFNITVALTLVAAAVCQLLTGLIIKLIYALKM